MATLDSSFLIAIERGVPGAMGRLEALLGESRVLRVPAAAWVEYLAPMAPSTRSKAARILETTAVFEPFTRDLADAAARLQHDLLRQGAALGWHDLQIAATALHYAEPLVSNDKGFDVVPGIERLAH